MNNIQMNNSIPSVEMAQKPMLPAVLRLPLKKKWYDMILSGKKKEEYRDTKEYWQQRLMNFDIVSRNSFSSLKKPVGFKHFDVVEFKNGYAKDAPTMLVEFKSVKIGEAKPEWSDNWQGEVFAISLGAVLHSR